MLYDSISKRVDFVTTSGNIVTFKKEQVSPNGTRFTQILIKKVQRDKDKVKLIGFGHDTDWFTSVRDLLEAADWKWMAQMHRNG